MTDMHLIARQMVAPGKGILAIDESFSTCHKRFEALGVASTEENRRDYRTMLITADNIERSVSGMILFDETLRQSATDGEKLTEKMKKKGLIIGIKVDTGAKNLALHEGEKVTEGLDGLRDRLLEYKNLGAQFAKWRAVITLGKNMPSEACLTANAHGLARYAALCQETGIVPMVEPEVIMEGDHDINRCGNTTARILRKLFAELAEQGVDLGATILKTSMVISGTKNEHRANSAEVAEKTVKVLKENVPSQLAGVVFLSGGQSPKEATDHLNQMNKNTDLPWPLSFSYGRSIQSPALKIWAKNPNAVKEAQKILVFHAQQNARAAEGKL